MRSALHRRRFLQRSAAAGAALAAAGPWQFGPARAGDEPSDLADELVRYDSAMERLVRIIEDTSRERVLEAVAAELAAGVPPRRLLAAVFLAGIRNVDPQPPGFKFHCVFVIHAVHQFGLDAAPGDRLLPLCYAVDLFKNSQADDVRLGDFKLPPPSPSLPSPEAAQREFDAAMQAWDIERADRAITILVRTCGANDVIESLWRYGARDFRNIGHKAMYVAHAWRTLQTIGWQYAEPTMRSLVRGLLDFGPDKRVNQYGFNDQAFLANVARCEETFDRLPATWTGRRAEKGATIELLEILREGKTEEACATAAILLSGGKCEAQAVWDAVHLAAGEWMMRQPGIFGIHCVTSANALRYAYETAADPQTRLVLLLQGVGWMGQFYQLMTSGDGRTRFGGFGQVKITDLEPAEIPEGDDEAVAQIFAVMQGDRAAAARGAFALARREPAARRFFQQGRHLLLNKVSEVHQFKYPAAVEEDFVLVSPEYRPHLAATAAYYLIGSEVADSPVIARAKELLGAG